MMRHGYSNELPRATIPTDKQVDHARVKDQLTREERDQKLNKTRLEPNLKVGQWVLTRNMRKRSKFDPSFGPELMKIIATELDGAVCEDMQGNQQRRHADDIKILDETQMVAETPVGSRAPQNVY